MKKLYIIGVTIVVIVLSVSILSWPIKVSRQIYGIGWDSNERSQRIGISVEGTYYFSLLLPDHFEGKIRIPYGPFKDSSTGQISGQISFSTLDGIQHGTISLVSSPAGDTIITGYLWMDGIFDKFLIDGGDGYFVAAPASSLEEAKKIKDIFW